MMKSNKLLFFFLLAPMFFYGQTTIEMKTKEKAPKISKHIYGHFAEHLGRAIYDGIYVGEDSKIPNTDGVRNDIVEALKAIKIPNLRWPGGCFADTYHWKDGIGPKDKRPTIVNQWWGGVTEDNSFGTHDFLNLAELLGAEPYLAGNVGSGEVKELADWVQYVNHDGESPMANWRRENGRKEPWKVKYWGVGNESWGCGGNMTPEYYADLYKRYATFLSSWSNETGIYRIAAGPNVDDYHWTEVLMKKIPAHLMEGIALHSYSVIEWENKGSATDFDEQDYFSTMKSALKMEELIEKHTAIMDKYDPDKKVDLIVDEWGGWYDVEEGTNPGFLYQQNTMRDAMIAGATLNIFNNHSGRVKMANLAQTVNVLQAVILTQEEKMILTPTYHVFKMYTVHHDAELIPVDFDAPTYQLGSSSLPAVSVSASKKTETGAINISLVNIDPEKEQVVELTADENSWVGKKEFKASILTSDHLQDFNSFDQPEKIEIEKYEGFTNKSNKLTVMLPPFSVVVLTGI